MKNKSGTVKNLAGSKRCSPAYLEVYIKNDGVVVCTPVTAQTKKVVTSFTGKQNSALLNAYCG